MIGQSDELLKLFSGAQGSDSRDDLIERRMSGKIKFRIAQSAGVAPRQRRRFTGKLVWRDTGEEVQHPTTEMTGCAATVTAGLGTPPIASLTAE